MRKNLDKMFHGVEFFRAFFFSNMDIDTISFNELFISTPACNTTAIGFFIPKTSLPVVLLMVFWVLAFSISQDPWL